MINGVVEGLINTNPIMFYVGVAILSLLVLSKSADTLVLSISHYAKKLGISDYLIGFIVVSIGTALPELVAALNGASMNQGAIVFGTIFGSNLFKLPLLGLVLIFARKIKITKNDMGVAPIVTLVMIAMPLLLVLDGYLSRFDGIVLIVAFIIYVSEIWQKEGKLGMMKKDISVKKIYKDAILFLVSLAVLLLSGKVLVISSLAVSELLKISPYTVGLVIIGIGASMPELTVQLRSIFTHHKDMAFGNVFGSLIANSALVLGFVAILNPFAVDQNLLWITAIVLTIGITYSLFLMGKKELTWKHGVVLVAFYAFYFILENIL